MNGTGLGHRNTWHGMESNNDPLTSAAQERRVQIEVWSGLEACSTE